MTVQQGPGTAGFPGPQPALAPCSWFPSADDAMPPRVTGRVSDASIVSRAAVVSSSHRLATVVGAEIAARGGNAVDVTVGTGLAMTVLEPHLCAFGGVAPTMVWPTDADLPVVFDGVGVWPSTFDLAAYRSLFDGDMPVGLPRSVAPGAPGAWMAAVAKFGRLRLAEVFEPSIRLCEEGFDPDATLCGFIAHFADRLRRWPSSAAVFLPGDVPPVPGEVFRQAEFGSLLRRLVEAEERARAAGAHRGAAIEAAIDRFYRGDIAAVLSGFAADEGWSLPLEDLATHSVEPELATVSSFGDARIFTSGPWSQGPMLTMLLNVLEADGLSADDLRSGRWAHRFLAAFGIVGADREAFFADPRHVDVPIEGLLDKTYAKERAGLIGERAAPLPPPGDPWRFAGRSGPAGRPPEPIDAIRPPDTSIAVAVDGDGTACVTLPSDHIFGSPLVPGLGIFISHRGSQFWLDDAHPAVLAPGRRPRMTPNPVMVRTGEGARIALGSPGEDLQVQATAQFLLRHLLLGESMAEAVDAPRIGTNMLPSSFFPHAFREAVVSAEDRLDPAVLDDLTERGHVVDVIAPYSYGTGALAIARRDESGDLEAIADARRPEAAAIGVE